MYRPDSLPKVLTSEEAAAILDQFNTRYRTPHRHRVMIRMMLEAGLRAGEVVALRRDHVDLEEGKLTVREGKGAKDRIVSFCHRLRDEIAEWLARDDWGDVPDTSLLFPTRTGKKVHHTTLWRAVKRAAKKAGDTVREPGRVRPHTFRHTYATFQYRSTKNLQLVRDLLGHSSIQTTQLYTHIANEEREEAGASLQIVP